MTTSSTVRTAKRVSLDLFEGRLQLIIYHFMWSVEGRQAAGRGLPELLGVCRSHRQSHLTHLHARGTSLALVSARADGQNCAVQGAHALESPLALLIRQ